MLSRRGLCTLLLCFAFIPRLHAQTNLRGNWEGISTQENGNRYSLSMHLEQTGDSLSGTMEEIYAEDANRYVLLRVTGKLRGDSIRLFDLSVISESSPRNILWCRKIRHGKIFRNTEGIRIAGSWENDGDYMFRKRKLWINEVDHCLPGNFLLYRKTRVDSIITIQKHDSLSLPVLPPASPEEKVLTQVAARKDVIKQRIEVFSDSLHLSFYDNGEIDGDSITVIYNGHVVLAHRGLTARPIEITIPVARGSENKLLMFADNEGSIPPNTALLIFYDRGKQYVVHLDADARSNAVVNIVRED